MLAGIGLSSLCLRSYRKQKYYIYVSLFLGIGVVGIYSLALQLNLALKQIPLMFSNRTPMLGSNFYLQQESVWLLHERLQVDKEISLHGLRLVRYAPSIWRNVNTSEDHLRIQAGTKENLEWVTFAGMWLCCECIYSWLELVENNIYVMRLCFNYFSPQGS